MAYIPSPIVTPLVFPDMGVRSQDSTTTPTYKREIHTAATYSRIPPKRIKHTHLCKLIQNKQMDLQNMQNHSMHLVLSSDAKPRLKWTPELHQRFLEAVHQLGGPEKATPKSLMRVMGIPGLTLYHLKSHLQKFRLWKSPQPEAFYDDKQEDYRETHSSDGNCSRETSVGTPNQMTESQQIAQALQMQMEVQRKLYEQIEVQRHLQLRIEAQGKYLQSVLMKAQEALAGYNSSAAGIELAKAELSQLVSIINNGCPSSPISELTETRVLSLKDGERKQNRGTMCSLESSLTSSESSGRKEEDPQNSIRTSVELQLMTSHPEDDQALNGDTKNQACGRKRSGATDSDGYCVEQPISKRCGNSSRKFEMLDLNSQYQSDTDTDLKTIDLNCSSMNSSSF